MVIILYQLVKQTTQLLVLLRKTAVEDLVSSVFLIYLQNHTMKNLRLQHRNVKATLPIRTCWCIKITQILFKASSINYDELIKLFVEIGNCCKICTKYKLLGLKPIVSFSLSKEFNNTVTVDLKEISGTKFLHIIDNATRFSRAAVLRSK